MPEIRAFAALRFDHKRTDGNLSDLIAPPYDILNQNDKNVLLAKNKNNIVAIDLPHIPPKSAGPAEVYEKAARQLQQHLDEGVLIQENQPAIYLYHQQFQHDAKTYTRKKFIARVRLSEFSEGNILPHEKTFGGPKEDRLALMKASKCQLSPIFGLYSDPEDFVVHTFTPHASNPPDATGKLDGVDNKMWIVTDRTAIDKVVTTLADKKIFIADGHHRYGTALMYRDWMRKQHNGTWPDDHPANYVMFVLASMSDPGCLILPYYRVIGNVDMETLLNHWTDGIEIVSADKTIAPTKVGVDLVLYDGKTGKETSLKFINRSILKSLEPDECDAWNQLDYAYLHRYLLDELLAKKSGESPNLHYVKSREDAIQTAQQQKGVALLVNATPMAHLRAVSEQAGLMPQKSTYFYPKLATGMTINPLE